MLEEPEHRIWLESYVDQLVLRDVPELGEIRDPSGLRRLLRAVIGNTAGIFADTEPAAAAGINVKMARRHEQLFDDPAYCQLPATVAHQSDQLSSCDPGDFVGIVRTVLDHDEGAAP
ncbi:MAG: hypothetical protein ACRDRZ_05980 [Pseudonocardiaceae bacterium]